MTKGVDALKRATYQMAVLNNKQLWLCIIMTRLRLIKYAERDEQGTPVGYIHESPITGKPICLNWHVNSFEWIHQIFLKLWATICWDESAERRFVEMQRMGWVHED